MRIKEKKKKNVAPLMKKKKRTKGKKRNKERNLCGITSVILKKEIKQRKNSKA